MIYGGLNLKEPGKKHLQLTRVDHMRSDLSMEFTSDLPESCQSVSAVSLLLSVCFSMFQDGR